MKIVLVKNVTSLTFYLNSQLPTCLLVHFVSDMYQTVSSQVPDAYLKKIIPVWNFTLVSQIKTKFTPAWDSLVRSNMWMLIMNLLSTLFVYVNLKMAPNLGKKCCEFFKLPDIFLILSYRKFTGGCSYLSVSCYYTWYFLICQYFNHDLNLAI